MLAGTPTQAGTYTFTVSATNALGAGTQAVTLTIAQAPLSVTALDQSKVYGDAVPDLTVGPGTVSAVGL